MKNFKNKKTLKIVLLVVIAVVTLGVGYAAISAVNLIINGNATASVDQNNFKVHFTQAQSITGTTGVSGTSSIDSGDDTKAMFDVTGLTKIGDYAEAVYTVRNDSNGIGAEITLNLTSSNTGYFKVTETILDDKLQAGEETTAKVKVEMIKTPITDSVSTTITATITATPLENAQASGGEENEVIKPTSFSIDSWQTIKTNVQNGNTSQYNIGDTKKVTINGTDYTVRIANKSTNENCSNESFSETACGFVVEFVDIITTIKMRDTSTSLGGYPETLVYAYLKDTLYGNLPVDLQGVIESTRVVSGYECVENGRTECLKYGNDNNNYVTNNFLYLLSETEVFGTEKYDSSSNTTWQLDFYKYGGTEVKHVIAPYGEWDNIIQVGSIKQYNNVDSTWWLRNPSSIYSGVFTLSSGGQIGQNPSNSSPFGVAPAFRIG